MSATALSPEQKSFALIASCTASASLDRLATEINLALDSHVTINEIKEVLVQMYAYCGFPRSLNGIATLMKVVEDRKSRGIQDEEGKAGEPLAKDVDKDAYGEKVRTDLVGAPVKGALFDFAPAIDSFLKEHLFADIFARGVLTHQDREVATIAALASLRCVDSQLASHIAMGKHTGLSDAAVTEILILASYPPQTLFPVGPSNDAYAQYFKGKSYLGVVNKDGVFIGNVTFEPRCRNNWHIHHKGGQILIITEGRGYYQEYGKEARSLKPGDVQYIPPETKHWHGAAKDSWFTHLAIEIPSEGGKTEWLEEVSDEHYNKLN